MTTSTLQEKAVNSIVRHNMLATGDHVVVAVSGGPDSVALLHVLEGLHDRLSFTLSVAHLNHKLRGEPSEKDADFVIEYAASLGLPCVVESEDVGRFCEEQGISIETGAREMRYAFLERVASSDDAQKIATGHTADDQAETILMRLLRGSGAGGLAGIRPVRDGNVIRPLLDASRQEVLAYLDDQGLAYCIDETNAETHHLRNHVRRSLLPVLQQDYNPEIVQVLCRIGEVLRTESIYMDHETERAFASCVIVADTGQVKMDVRTGNSLPVALQRRLVRHMVHAAGGQMQELTFDHIERFREFVAQEKSGRLLNLPGGLIVERRRDQIIVCRGMPEPFDMAIYVPGVTDVPVAGCRLDVRIIAPEDAPDAPDDDCALFDADLIQLPIQVRSRRSGDRIAPNGMAGTKALKAVFKERNIPRVERDRVAVVVSATDILWVAGHRRSRIARVTPGTKRVLMITCLQGAPNHL